MPIHFVYSVNPIIFIYLKLEPIYRKNTTFFKRPVTWNGTPLLKYTLTNISFQKLMIKITGEILIHCRWCKDMSLFYRLL